MGVAKYVGLLHFTAQWGLEGVQPGSAPPACATWFVPAHYLNPGSLSKQSGAAEEKKKRKKESSSAIQEAAEGESERE